MGDDYHLTTAPVNLCAMIDFGAQNPCAVPPCPTPVVPVAVPFDFDGPTNPRVLDNPVANFCAPGTPIGDRGVDEVP
jgi:hypothetical protein